MESEVKRVVEEALRKSKDVFNIEDVSVEIKEDQAHVIPETGVGGFTPDSYTIFVYYDTHNEHFKQNFREEVKSTVAHEFHHAVRNRTYNWQEDTLLGAIVTEGLADHFDLEINGGSPKLWSTALTDVEIDRLESLAALEFNSKEYNHSDWFFGSSERKIPKWAGYSIGFKIVGDYLKKSGMKASELVSEPARSFIATR